MGVQADYVRIGVGLRWVMTWDATISSGIQKLEAAALGGGLVGLLTSVTINQPITVNQPN